MITYRCDGCGKELPKRDLRYTVDIQVKAAYGQIEFGLIDLVQNHRAEILALLERLKHKDPREIEETVFKRIMLDLCPSCQRAFIRSPLRFHPEQGAPPSEEVDIDGFLRSLGIADPPNGASET